MICHCHCTKTIGTEENNTLRERSVLAQPDLSSKHSHCPTTAHDLSIQYFILGPVLYIKSFKKSSYYKLVPNWISKFLNFVCLSWVYFLSHDDNAVENNPLPDSEMLNKFCCTITNWNLQCGCNILQTHIFLSQETQMLKYQKADFIFFINFM